MFLRCLLILLVTAFMTGCETPDTIGPVSYQPFDKGFEKYTMTRGGTFAGAKTILYLRRGQSSGNLQICGFYIKSDGMSEDLTQEWFKYAKITINGDEIVSTKFLLPQERLLNAESACVVTTTKYQASLIAGKVSLKGRRIRLIY